MLILYYKPTCPYCQRVLSEAETLGISFTLKDISTDETLRAELIERGGKKQVPYLIDTTHNVALYESNDIVTYLRKEYGDGTQPQTFQGLRVHRSEASCDVCE